MPAFQIQTELLEFALTLTGPASTLTLIIFPLTAWRGVSCSRLHYGSYKVIVCVENGRDKLFFFFFPCVCLASGHSFVSSRFITSLKMQGLINHVGPWPWQHRCSLGLRRGIISHSGGTRAEEESEDHTRNMRGRTEAGNYWFSLR